MLCRCDEGSKLDEERTPINFNECYEILGKKLDDGSTSKMQDFEHLEGMDHNNFSKHNDSNKDETSENISEEIDLNDNSEMTAT